jgi:hypothetical protein
VLAIVVIGGNTPEGDPSAAKVTSFYQQHHTREIAAAFVLAAAVPFVVSFIPYADFFALVLSGVWIIAMSIMLFRMDRERRFASAPQAAIDWQIHRTDHSCSQDSERAANEERSTDGSSRHAASVTRAEPDSSVVAWYSLPAESLASDSFAVDDARRNALHRRTLFMVATNVVVEVGVRPAATMAPRLDPGRRVLSGSAGVDERSRGSDGGCGEDR